MYSNTTVSDLIEKIYEVPTHPRGLASFTQRLEEVVNGGVAIFARRPSSVSIVTGCSTCPPELAMAYESSYWTDDRAMERVDAVLVGDPILDTALVDARQRLRSPFYNDYLGMVGCERGLYVPFLRNAGETVLVSAQRSARHGDYDGEIDLVRQLVPHLARSFRTWRRLKALEEERAAALSGMKQAGIAMLLVDRCGRVVFGNEGAEAELRTDVLRVVNGRISATGRRDDDRLRKAIERATGENGAQSHTLMLTGLNETQLTVTVAPHVSTVLPATAEPLAMLLLYGIAPRRLDLQFLADEYAMTPAEIRLLNALVSGEHLSAYAARSGVKITTVKTHLGSLFDKTGQRRQSDLIRFVLETLPPADAAHYPAGV